LNLGWQQILTQIFGFLILLWILKKYAWKPMLDMMDERRQKIADEFNKIDQLNADVAQLRQDLETRLARIEETAREKETVAIAEGRRISSELQVKAREDAREIIEKAKDNIELEVAKARVDLRNQIVEIAMDAAEKVIKEELDDAKHRQKIEEFIGEIGQVR
jgi:F-type H+-transporting ATPase subunit b